MAHFQIAEIPILQTFVLHKLKYIKVNIVYQNIKI